MSSAIKIRQVGIVDVDAGQNVTVVEPCNLYGCRLGDGVFVGPFVEIQKTSALAPAVKSSLTALSANMSPSARTVLSATT